MILHTLIDFWVLKLIWWGLTGVILIGFAVTDGFDMGTTMLLPFVGKTDAERRVVINTVGPVWEGNQVWFILGGGAVFAAWPILYALSFSGFYLAMFLILAALILRPVGFKYRSKREGANWRRNWDWALFVGGLVPSLLMGVALGNAMQGVPFTLSGDLRIDYQGSLIGLLNPFGLLAGLLSVAMMVMHGAAWLSLKSEGEVNIRARQYGGWAALTVIALFALGGLAAWLWVPFYAVSSGLDPNMPPDPLLKSVTVVTGGLVANYARYPWMIIAPVLGFAGAALAWASLRGKRELLAWILTSLSVAGIVATAGVSMFPFMLPSSIAPKMGLTVWDASASHLTLFNMAVAAVLFVPIIVFYTSYAYKIIWGKVTEADVADDSRHSY